MSDDKCPRVTRFMSPCRFEARYDTSEPILPDRDIKVALFNPDDWKRKTYVCDICTECGKQVVRPKT